MGDCSYQVSILLNSIFGYKTNKNYMVSGIPAGAAELCVQMHTYRCKLRSLNLTWKLLRNFCFDSTYPLEFSLLPSPLPNQYWKVILNDSILLQKTMMALEALGALQTLTLVTLETLVTSVTLETLTSTIQILSTIFWVIFLMTSLMLLIKVKKWAMMYFTHWLLFMVLLYHWV